jgi:hypothetical protein
MENWELDFHWLELRHKLKEVTQATDLPGLKAILLLIGIQEYGRIKEEFSKEEKQDLMHVAACTLLEADGYYEFAGRDDEGWPHWDIVQPFTTKGSDVQEKILKTKILDYFKKL